MAEPLRLPAPAYVYVIGAADGPQKIGSAVNPASRRMMLQVGNPAILAVAYAHPVSRALVFKVEHRAHGLLADKRVRGDWFDVSPEEAVAAIREAARQIEAGEPAQREAIDQSDWAKRAKRAGLSQKDLARLLGVAENTVSLQLRGKWQSGTPRYVKTLIRAWEMLPQAQREALMDGAEDE